MRGLTREERRALEPIGPPGEHASAETLRALFAQRRVCWKEDGEGPYLAPTALGELALRVCPEEA